MATTEQQTFYDQHPFDWVPADASGELASVMSPPLVDFIQSLGPESLVLDVGCGPGRVLGFLARRGLRCIGLDRSRVSLALAVQRYRRPGTVGDNLHLPFADSSADVVISDGVIHHTENPHAAFLENFRVLKPGGRMYLAVYKASGRYPLLYKFPGAWIRAGLRHGWSKPFIVLFFRVPYFLVHLVRSKGARTWAAARNLFYDYFVTPQVAFLPRQTVEAWCAALGARVLHYQENRGQNVHSFILLKEAAHPEEHRGTIPVSEALAIANHQKSS
ncbi:MAG: class I SAM-dependent methyltransferase [Candidatus Acidiferrales bacterium]